MENIDLDLAGGDNRTSIWSQDGGEALGTLGNRMLGGHKLVNLASSIFISRLHLTIIDHCMNQYTPWSTNKQTTDHRLRILGNPSYRSIDIRIPTQQGQTCVEAIQVTLQIIGCQQGQTHLDSGEIQVFTSNHNPKGGPDHPVPTGSEHTGLLLLQHYSIVKPNARLTMFIPEATNTTTWTSACLAEDTEIRLADSIFTFLQHSIGKEIWTDHPNTRKKVRHT